MARESLKKRTAYRLLENKGALTPNELMDEMSQIFPETSNFEEYPRYLKRKKNVRCLHFYFKTKYFSPEERAVQENQSSFIYILGREPDLGENLVRSILPKNPPPGAKNYFRRLFKKLKIPKEAYDVVENYLRKSAPAGI